MWKYVSANVSKLFAERNTKLISERNTKLKTLLSKTKSLLIKDFEDQVIFLLQILLFFLQEEHPKAPLSAIVFII